MKRKIIKGWRRAIKYISAAVLAGAAIAYALVSRNTTQCRPVTRLENLIVNTSDDRRYEVQKSEEEGIQDIRKLVKSSDLEESWIYLPEKELWVETGINEKRVESDHLEGIYVFLDIDLCRKLTKENDNLIFYHFHPYEIELLYEKEEEFKPFLIARNSIPSSGDLSHMAMVSLVFNRVNPDGKINFKVCSSEGIAEYSLTERGKYYFGKTTPGELKKIMEIKHFRSFSSALFLDAVAPSRFTVSPQERIQQLIELLNDEYMTVKFSPYENKELTK
jgi:hypothetical protein